MLITCTIVIILWNLTDTEGEVPTLLKRIVSIPTQAQGFFVWQPILSVSHTQYNKKE